MCDPQAAQLVRHVDVAPLGSVALEQHERVGRGRRACEAYAEPLARAAAPVEPVDPIAGVRANAEGVTVALLEPAHEPVEIAQARPSAFARIQSWPTARWTKFRKKAGEFFSYTQ